jgi:hypothetical protein
MASLLTEGSVDGLLVLPSFLKPHPSPAESHNAALKRGASE